ncbi:MAG TPA: low temperature requirement protein A [Pseudonocardiaceae bacterium]|nr:low temperature requirement protein A [Pseudonocardiaceae bacterium]
MTGSTRRGSGIGIWKRVMMARDREQEYRSSTPLELFFDLCFVVAVAQAGNQLHHGLAEGFAHGNGWSVLIRYVMLFFGIWWAWINFTWFASAYDTDDVFYRLLTLLQIAGVLVLAAGVPVGFTTLNFTVITVGYVLMRIAMIAQWIRVSIEYPPGRPAAIRYAVGIGVAQIGWVIRLFLPHPWDLIVYAVLAVMEMVVPMWAESGGRATSWHPDHIYDRYSSFTLIVLGECVAALTIAMQGVVSGEHMVVSLIVLAAAAILLVFGLWWAYFKNEATEVLRASLRTTMIWAYSHFFVFMSIAALGATLSVAAEVAAEAAKGEKHVVTVNQAALMVALPVAVFLLTGNVLHGRATRAFRVPGRYVTLIAAVVVGLAWTAGAIGLAAAIGLMGLVVACLVTVYLIGQHRWAMRELRDDPLAQGADQASAATG